MTDAAQHNGIESPLNMLVVYGAIDYPIRTTTWSHLYCFRRYSAHRCFYVNVRRRRRPWYRGLPWYLRATRFDVILFHTDLMGLQWGPDRLEWWRKAASHFKDMKGIKVAFTQDEFCNTDVLSGFIDEFGIDHVFSLAPEAEWPKIYPDVDSRSVAFHRVLPGYLDDDVLRRIARMTRDSDHRPIDISYRAYGIRQHLGRHGFLKIQIADRFSAACSETDLVCDISTRLADTFFGDAWFKFLLRSKYTLGVEGGATVLDRDGTFAQRTERYLELHPEAPFEEVEDACFPGADGYYKYLAISPRHLEACATRTAQVLIEGEYNGVLTPGRHYIEVKRDFSNLEEVIATLVRDDVRERITDAAYSDIVATGKYTYRQFVRRVVEALQGDLQPHRLSTVRRVWVYITLQWTRLVDGAGWWRLGVMTLIRNGAKSYLPAGVVTAWRLRLARKDLTP